MISLLPPNATNFERAIEGAMARISDIPAPIEQLWNPSTCPVALLPYLAYALSVDTWSPDWPEPVKRERIRRALLIQRYKGTVRSVRDIIASFGGAISIREWWETAPQGTPHTFQLVLSLTDLAGGAPSAAYVAQVIDDITRAKPVRSSFTFTLALASAGRVGSKAVARPAIYARLQMASPAAA